MDPPERRRLDGPGSSLQGPAAHQVTGPPRGGRHEILLVEDNPGDVALFQEAVEESEVRGRLRVASTGADALSMVEAGDAPASEPPVDLVVLDLDLPDRPGLAVLEALKGDPDTRPIPVVILSTSDDRADVRRAYELGANAYFEKRMHFAETVALVEALRAFWFEAAELPR